MTQDVLRSTSRELRHLPYLPYLRELFMELAEHGAGDDVIMSIAKPLSHAMIARYSRVRTEAKWALDEIAAGQHAAEREALAGSSTVIRASLRSR